MVKSPHTDQSGSYLALVGSNAGVKAEKYKTEKEKLVLSVVFLCFSFVSLWFFSDFTRAGFPPVPFKYP